MYACHFLNSDVLLCRHAQKCPTVELFWRTSFRGNIPYKLLKVAIVSSGPIPRNCYEAIPLTDRGPNTYFSCVGPDQLTEVLVGCGGRFRTSLIKVIVFHLIVPALDHLATIDAVVNHSALAFWNRRLKIC